MRRWGRTEKCQMHNDANPAFHKGYGGAKVWNRRRKAGKEKAGHTHRPPQQWCTFWTASHYRSVFLSCQRKCILPVKVEKKRCTNNEKKHPTLLWDKPIKNESLTWPNSSFRLDVRAIAGVFVGSYSMSVSYKRSQTAIQAKAKLKLHLNTSVLRPAG